MLVRLAKGEAEYTGFERRNLQEVCTNYQTSVIPNKTDEYRMRYNELLDIEDWTQADIGFFDYAANDVISLHELYSKLYQEGYKLVNPYLSTSAVYPTAIEEFGLLTESIQVKASIAISQMTRNGIKISLDKAKELDLFLRNELHEKLQYLKDHHDEIFDRYKKKNNGDYKYTEKSNLPKVKLNEVRKILEEVAKELEIEVPRSSGKRGNVSIAENDWKAYEKKDKFLTAWFGQTDIKKMLGFTNDLMNSNGCYHCSYDLMKKTGRLSCYRT